MADRIEGERERLLHSLERLREVVATISRSYGDGYPMAQDAQTLLLTAGEVASQLWKLDAFILAKQDEEGRGPR